MYVSGIVGTEPRDSSFETSKGDKVKQVSFKLLDDTADILPCVMPMDGSVPVKGSKIKAEVVMVRPIKFGEGFVVQLRHVEVVSDVLPFGSPQPPPLKK